MYNPYKCFQFKVASGAYAVVQMRYWCIATWAMQKLKGSDGFCRKRDKNEEKAKTILNAEQPLCRLT